MFQMSTAEARENFAEIMNNAIYKHERTVLTRRGKRVVAIIPVSDLAILEALEDQADENDAKLAISEIKEQGSISLSNLKRELEL